MRKRVLVAVVTCALIAACGERVPSALPTIDPVPSLTIRVPDSIGGPSVELGRAVRLADGGVAVADLLGRRLLRFGADGALLRMYGGPGSTSGLYRAPSLIEAVPGDSLLVWDPVLRRVTWLSLASGETRDLTFQTSLVYGTAPIVGQMNDGTLLLRHELQEQRPARPSVSLETPMRDGMLPGADVVPTRPTPTPLTEVRAEVVRLDKSGRQVAELTNNVLVRELTGEGFRFFAPALQMSTDGERVVLGYNGEWKLRVLSADGDSVATLTREWTPREVTDAEREAVRRALSRSTAEGAAAEPQFLPTRPAFGRVLMSRDGTIWATEFSAPGVYVDSATVFNREGSLLGTLAMPPRFSPTEVGRDYVLGLGAGDDGVTELRLYPVRQ